MNLCPRCEVWLPVDYDHSKAECDEHIRDSRVIKRRADAWQLKYPAGGVPVAQQLTMEVDG